MAKINFYHTYTTRFSPGSLGVADLGTKVTKKLFLIGLLFTMGVVQTFAQMSYTRSSFTGSYTAITTGGGASQIIGGTGTGDFSTSSGTSNIDDGTAYIPLPFNFTYAGTTYTATSNFIGICTNGYAYFSTLNTNASKITTQTNTNLFTTTTPNNTVAPYYDDLDIGPENSFTGTVLYQTTGSSGSQVFTVQWGTYPSYFSGNARGLNFQLKIYETTNVVEFWYGTAVDGTTPGGNSSESASIGIEDGTGGPNHYIDALTGSGLTNNTMMNSGRFPKYNFRFTPGAPTAISTGTYNVGSGQTYPNLSEAVADLNHRGISGAVTLNLTDATYDASAPNGSNIFPILLGPVTGSSASNTILIQRTSGTSTINSSANTPVTGGNFGNQASTTAGSSTSEPVIGVIGADYVTMQNLFLTGVTGSATVDRGLLVLNSSATDGATNNLFQNISVTLDRTNTSSIGIQQNVVTTPTSAAGANTNNKYYNLTIKNVFSGLYLLGNATFPDLTCEVGNTVCTTFNVIGDPATSNDIGNGSSATWGLRASNQSGVKIYNNEIQNVTTTGAVAVDGILVETFQGTSEVYNNKIHDVKSTSTSTSASVSGMRLTHTTTGTHTLRVYNNFINGLTTGNPSSASATRTVKGINISGTGGATTQVYEVYHNSVRIDNTAGANGSNACFEIATTTGPIFTVVNNILSNSTNSQTGVARHYGVRSTSATLLGNTGSVYQNNDIYIANQVNAQGFTALGNATDYNGVSAWQTANAQATANIESDPSFTSATDLHSSAVAINAGGTTAPAYVTNDIDCQSRPQPSATNFDIGADEFLVNNNDVGITDIILPATFCAGSNSVQATIKNFGALTLNSVLVDWTITPGGMQPQVNPTVSLAPGASTTITLGDFVFSAGTSYSIMVTTSLPNGNSDENTSNDAFTLGSVSTGLNGTYTVGSGGNFATITAAATAFNARSVCGPVTLNLTDATYNSETLPITFNVNTNMSMTNTLIIKPTLTSTTITGSSSSAVIIINGADYVTIDGSTGSTANTVCPASSASRDLTITNTNINTSSAVIWLQTNGSDGATNNTIKNCNLVGSGNTQTLLGIGSGSSTISTSSLGTGNNNNSFINNNISKTQYGIYSQGASAANKNSGTIINQNIINTVSPNNVSKGGIWTGFENSITISGNNISEISQAGSPDVFGITLGAGTTMSSTALGTNEVTNATVTKNVIGNIINSGTFSSAGISVAIATSGTNLIANNIISGITANGTSGDFAGGIVIGGGTGSTTQVYYNTVAMQGAITGSTAATQTSACLAVTNSTGPTLDLRNNIFSNTQIGNSGASLRFASIALGYSTFTLLTSNNNDLYCAGVGPGTYQIGITGTIVGGTNHTTLANWQTNTGKDAASKNISPVFISSTDLHINGDNPANYPLNNTADGTTGISDDIDCNSRSTDIGADEFVFTACDVVSAGTATGSTSLCNSGSTTINASGYSTGTGTTYLWQRSLNNFSTVLDSTVVVDPSSFATGTITTTTYYRLKVKCSSNSSSAVSNIITINVNIVTASVSPSSPTICSGAMIALTETAGTGSSWLWSPGGSTTSFIMVAPTMTTLYTVTVTGAGGCTATSTSNVTVNPTPVASTGTYGPVCLNDPDVTLVGSPPGGTWSGTGVTGNTFDPSAGTQTLTYTVTDMGCSSSASTTIEVKAVMTWVFLPNGTTNGSCVSGTNCCSNTLCYGLQYTPAHTGNLTSYTTGFFVNCVGGGSPVLSNASCVMTNNSSETNECANYNLVLFNSSGNTGVIPVMKDVPLILHKVCFNDPVGQTLTIEEDTVTKLTTSLDVSGNYVNEFSCFQPFIITRTAPIVPANGSGTVACAALAVPPGAPSNVTDQCGTTLTGVLTNTVSTPPTITCEGTRTYTYTFTNCVGQSTDWSYTYTIEYIPFANPTDAGSTVSCPSSADVEPTSFLPTVLDNCGITLSPSAAVVSDPVVCEGTRTYTYTYTDCEGNTQDWVYTYTVERAPIANPTDNGSTVSCPAATNVEPTAFLPVVVDNCGVTLTPSAAVVSDPVICEGTRTYTYTYTDCGGNTQDWVYTYTVDRLPFADPMDDGMTVPYPDDADVEPTAYLPVVVDNCGITLTPSAPVVSAPIVCEGTRTYTYTYTDCGGNTQDWVFTYTVVHSDVVTNTNDNGNGSLRNVIECALDGETITFSLPSMSVITLTSGEILINKNLTIQGLGKLNLTISGNYPNMASSRIFHLIAGKSLNIKDLSLKNATADPNGGAIFVEGDLTLQEVLLENNYEGLAAKGLTLVSPGTVTIIGNVEIKP